MCEQTPFAAKQASAQMLCRKRLRLEFYSFSKKPLYDIWPQGVYYHYSQFHLLVTISSQASWKHYKIPICCRYTAIYRRSMITEHCCNFATNKYTKIGRSDDSVVEFPLAVQNVAFYERETDRSMFVGWNRTLVLPVLFSNHKGIARIPVPSDEKKKPCTSNLPSTFTGWSGFQFYLVYTEFPIYCYVRDWFIYRRALALKTKGKVEHRLPKHGKVLASFLNGSVLLLQLSQEGWSCQVSRAVFHLRDSRNVFLIEER